jgi:DnaA regulatory inactivator Hda
VSDPTQLPLDLGSRPSLAGEDFLVVPGNQQAVAWLDRWPDWPSPALVVYGPAGCGKTHLASVFMARTDARNIPLDRLTGEDPPRLLADTAAVVVEDIDRCHGRAGEEALLHLYNIAAETGRHLLLTARKPPSLWDLSLADLRSRLATAVTVAIAPPDDTLMAALLVKLFADRQLRVDADVVTFMLSRMERSFDAARQAVAAIDAAALEQHRNVTVPFVRLVMARLAGDDQPDPEGR